MGPWTLTRWAAKSPAAVDATGLQASVAAGPVEKTPRMRGAKVRLQCMLAPPPGPSLLTLVLGAAH